MLTNNQYSTGISGHTTNGLHTNTSNNHQFNTAHANQVTGFTQPNTVFLTQPGYVQGVQPVMYGFSTAPNGTLLDNQWQRFFNAQGVLPGITAVTTPGINSFAIPLGNEINLNSFGYQASGFTGLQPTQSTYEPATYVTDEDNSTIINIEVSGVSEKEINVALRGDVIIITGNKQHIQKQGSNVTGNTFVLGNAWTGRFQRAIRLGYTPELKQITAQSSNGILTITVKKPQTVKSENIKVTAA